MFGNGVGNDGRLARGQGQVVVVGKRHQQGSIGYGFAQLGNGWLPLRRRRRGIGRKHHRADRAGSVPGW
ncbi:hypothetical protein D3C72_1653450 [compost metagenome]